MKINFIKKILITLSLAALPTAQSLALEGDNWWLGGRVKQGVSLAYDLEDGGSEIGPSNFLLELNGNWIPTDSITVTGSFWFRGDLYPDIGGDINQGGIQDFTSPGIVAG